MIRLKRVSCWTDRLRAYKVILDGNTLGEIGNGEEREFKVPAGKHTLKMKIDWCGSNTIDFETQGNPVEFECGSNLGGTRALLAIFYVFFLRNEYVWLKRK